MANLVALLVFLCFEVSAFASRVCKVNNRKFIFCEDGCCGGNICCSPSSTAPTTYYSFSVMGVIIAFVVGACIFIGIIICCVKACSTRTPGRVIRQNQPGVVMVSPAQQGNYPIGQQAFQGQPQPYPDPTPYPDTTPYPTQPGYINFAYPPSYAAYPPPYGFNTEQPANSEINPVPTEAASK